MSFLCRFRVISEYLFRRLFRSGADLNFNHWSPHRHHILLTFNKVLIQRPPTGAEYTPLEVEPWWGVCVRQLQHSYSMNLWLWHPYCFMVTQKKIIKCKNKTLRIYKGQGWNEHSEWIQITSAPLFTLKTQCAQCSDFFIMIYNSISFIL